MSETDDATSSGKIGRKKWVGLYERGFKLGTRERSLQPSNRRDSVEPRLNAEHGYSEDEIDALQAGYELGCKGSFPGSDIDVQQKANTAFDRSGHATGLSQWADGK